MTRWSLGNRLYAITERQFMNLTSDFRDACAQSWRQDCTLVVRVLRSNQVYTTFYDEEAFARLKAENDANTLLETGNPADVSPALFDAARHIIVTVRPSRPESAPASAFGQVEFKGNFNRRATFYVQPGGEDVRAALLAANPRMKRHDGFEPHGDQDAGAIITMAARAGMPAEAVTRILKR